MAWILIAAMVVIMVLSVALNAGAAESSAAGSSAAASSQEESAQADSSVSSETASSEETVSSVSDSSLIKDGITLDGIDLSGMTVAQAREQAQQIADKMSSAKITLKGSEEGIEQTASASDFGVEWSNPDVIDTIASYGHASNIIARYKEDKDLEVNGADFAVEAEADKTAISDYLTEHTQSMDQKAQDATLSWNGSGFDVIEGTEGIVVNIDSSTEKIYTALTDGWQGEDLSISLDFEVDEPEGDTSQLSEIQDVLGTFTTYYPNSGEARCANIANGCSLISGSIVYPGEEFSVLEHLTPFTEENGYQMAGSYVANEVVESLGGGICQVSTTLYNAVIRAELEVTQRSNHSLIVSYVKPSEDAAIAESAGMDFKFVNNLDYPVYLQGSVANKSITFTVYGKETRDPGRKVEFESETLETIPSEGCKVKTDASQPIGYVSQTAGHTGYKAQLWKIVTQDGVEVSREVFNKSTYAMTPTEITVGTAGTMTAELQAAIDSADYDTIVAAAENAKNGTSSNAQTAAQTAAQEAAQEAYAAALAEGDDVDTAMAKAQDAANQAVLDAAAAAGESASADSSSSETSDSSDSSESASSQDTAASEDSGEADADSSSNG